MDVQNPSRSPAAPCPRCSQTTDGVSRCDTPSTATSPQPCTTSQSAAASRFCFRPLPHRSRGHSHAGRAGNRLGSGWLNGRSHTRHHCVVRGQHPWSWSRDLTDTAVPHRHRGGRDTGQTIGVGVSSRGGGAGLPRRQPDAADLQDPTRGIRSGQRSGCCVRCTGGQCDAQQARGSGHDQLGGCLHHVFALHSNARFRVAAMTLSAPHEMTWRTG